MLRPTKFLVTGANRGFGKGLVRRLLERPSATVVAAVRDPSDPTSKALEQLHKAPGAQLIIIKIDAAAPTDAGEAVAQLRQQGIDSLDIVFANAGIFQEGKPVLQTSAENTLRHMSVNVLGPLTLLQATADLLRASSTGKPAFIATSSIVGSIGSQDFMKNLNSTSSPYGASKAALNWFVRLVSFEEPWLTSFVFYPGLVETDVRVVSHLKELNPISVEQSVTNVLKILFEMVPEELNGTFRNHDGGVILW